MPALSIINSNAKLTFIHLLLIKCIKLFTPDFKESGAFMRTHQSPVFIALNTSHEQIWNPQTQEQISSSVLFSASVLPAIKKLENVSVPRLQVNGKCTGPLKYITVQKLEIIQKYKLM